MDHNETFSEKHWYLLEQIEHKGLDTQKFQHILNDLERNGNPLLLEQLVEILYFCLKK
ncbi:hypothetical protein [Fictibacillus barbaricus]|uniref:Uncharacterized protein n=1 Tax=Fictibacillus barbaricus TaxID=182136 RepID=A0ABS2Z9S6_9BACL|nr:hypothetical protein [Fictibacillus barbaricus]MBN3544913.1 hypothetical protein [Fictibacillus barbaricus]GGB63127.1 hypothetical protein GCM10007199_31400 [Fictibacillus barbaricus]